MNRMRPFALCTLTALALLLTGCDPLAPAPRPTQQVIVVTSEPTNTPLPTATSPFTRTPVPSPTPRDTPTPTPLPCPDESGEVLNFDQFRSDVAEETIRYRVYIPPCYIESQRRYPVVFLLTAAGENETFWDEALDVDEALDQGIRLGVLPPMILVMPGLGAIGAENLFPPDASYETVLLDEIIPAVDRDFCTWASRDHRALAGISRGGFWALSVGFRHPDLFETIAGHSAYLDQDSAPPAFNPLQLALDSAFLAEADLRLFLDNGASDTVSTNMELLSSRLSSRGIAHSYTINPVGDHSETYWKAHLSEYLTFYGETWTRNTSQLPDCAEPSPE